MRIAVLLLVPVFALFGCSSGSADGPARPDSGPHDAGTPGSDAGPPDLGSPPADLGPAQELSAMLTADACGMLHAAGTVDIPTGSTVTICAGSQLTFDSGAALRVHGTLHVAGTAASRVTFAGTGAQWTGVSVYGTLDAHFLDITQGHLGVQTVTGATATVEDSTITVPDRSSVGLDIAGGGTFDRTHITGGGTMEISGGTLSMTDSVIDLQQSQSPPPLGDLDCTHNDGGSVMLDHVQITGCHCPLHFNRTNNPVMVTNSLFDNAFNPVMIADTTATFRGNAFLGLSTGVLDIGGGATADLAMNYWGGPHASYSAMGSSTFTGTSDAEALTEMPAGVGPR